MSLTATTATKAMELQVRFVNAIDPCALDNKTSQIAKDIFLNIKNFALGTGKWIVFAILVSGLIAYFFGNDELVKRGTKSVLILAFLGVIIAVAEELIGDSGCVAQAAVSFLGPVTS